MTEQVTEQTYRMRLGDFIREVDVRNTGLNCKNLLGLSISKMFIPSIANTIGTDLRNYKLVCKGQFGYVPVTSRNGDKITVALYDKQDDCIISQAYTVFEVIDPNVLMPEYLMMWFRRPEFDRYARFHSHGSAREVFDWDEMCDVMLPIPPIEEQREIVARHQAIERRIEINRKTIARLEEAAQVIYRKMFVDGIDPENLPDGWRMGVLKDIGKIIGGATPSTQNKDFWVNEGIRWLSPIDLSKRRFIFTTESFSCITMEAYNSCSTKLLPIGTVLFSSRAPIGLISVLDCIACTNQGFKSVVPLPRVKFPYIYFLLKDSVNLMNAENTGSTFSEVSGNYMNNFPVVIPPYNLLDEFNSLVLPLFNHIKLKEKEISILNKIL